MAIIKTTTTMPQQQQPRTNTIESSTTTTTATTTMVVVSDYEQTREQRIKENRERLQKLGIVDLSLQLKSISSTASRRTTPKSSFNRNTPLKPPSVGPTEPCRRSSRLQNAPPVAYVEPKEEKSRRSRDIVLEVGSKPEFYFEEHEKLLGNTEMPWTCFVDGCAADGTRIYDSVKGKTCHQCRQKTLGQRTRCCQCNLVQGQFCGDCLYMRYGEHVVEASQNPNWICPPCRGICNCSLCHQAKGWPATGALYRRISRLGYKSVAHYLMATKRTPPEEDIIADTQQLAKRCLPFEGMQVPTDNASDEKGTDENNVTHATEPNQTLEKSFMNGKEVEVAFEGMQVPTDNASDEKARDENNITRDTEPNQTPEESVVNGKVVEDVVHVDKRPVGRRRKRSMEENFNTDVVVHVEKRPVGRPRKRSMEEKFNYDVVVNVEKRPIGRPRKRSMADNRNSDEAPLSTDVKKDELHNSTFVTDNASDDKAPDESNHNPVIELTQTPKSVVNGEMAQDVLEDVVHVEKRPVGRPRKRSMEENCNADVVVHAEKRPVGRPRKRSMEENFDSDVVVNVEKRPIGRPRKRSMAENLNSDEAPLSTDVKKDELHNSTSVANSASDDKATDESNPNPVTELTQTPKSVVNGEMAQDVLVLVKKRPVGRPRKGSEKENLNTGSEPLSTYVKKNEFVSEMQSPHSSTIVTDSVARRLRPRNKT